MYPVETLVCPVFLQLLTTCTPDPAAVEPPRLPRHAACGGRRVGAVEHHSRRLRLLPYQRHGGEDPHAGECPFHPPVCDRRPVRWSDPAHDIHTMEKTLRDPLDQQSMTRCPIVTWDFRAVSEI